MAAMQRVHSRAAAQPVMNTSGYIGCKPAGVCWVGGGYQPAFRNGRSRLSPYAAGQVAGKPKGRSKPKGFWQVTQQQMTASKRSGAPKRKVTTMMPVSVPKVLCRPPGQKQMEWVDLWEAYVIRELSRNKWMDPKQAIEYGMIDKVLTTPMPKMPTGPAFKFERNDGLAGL
ncbi:hypothetical protein TSOC_012242 [Tetrabaena socialis]|uniref:ATP-dependent Clp protease proteolytic subunit n=1 Tax=Tetrabaena socialis TaxID=47790 RepID=A0A2J7ZNJ2_9CHLO|nr:hypothetical protein TSOC_012242 [Tetrabaena socialis]|eukprot:PNH01836.1 hypothetical protein TSOC_012242 [Tetrabaena socialis]